eukprot:SAG11_NODE_2437_length_3364_cov_10.869525_1_plen_68_part_00
MHDLRLYTNPTLKRAIVYKEAYKIKVLTPEETETNRKHSAYFEAKLPSKIDEEKVNKTIEKSYGEQS